MQTDNLYEILQCPDCGARITNDLQCEACRQTFSLHNDIYDFLPSKELPRLAIFNDPHYQKYHQMLAASHDYFYNNANPIIRWIQCAGYRRINTLLKKRNGLILETGCGSGMFLQLTKDINRSQYVMLDNDYPSLELIEPKKQLKAIIHGTAYKLPFRDSSFDTIISHAQLEHLCYLDCALEETKRTLKANGEFLVSVPTEGGMLWTLGRSLTSARHFSKMLNIDYITANRIDHFNTIHQIERALKRYFRIKKRYLFPFRFPSFDWNLVSTYVMTPL